MDFSSAKWIPGTRGCVVCMCQQLCIVAVSYYVCLDTSVYVPCQCVSCLSANICVFCMFCVHVFFVLCVCPLPCVCANTSGPATETHRWLVQPVNQPNNQTKSPFWKHEIWNKSSKMPNQTMVLDPEIFGWSCERCPYFLSDQGPICQSCYAGVMLLISGQHYELLSSGFIQVLDWVKAPHAWVRCAFGNV